MNPEVILKIKNRIKLDFFFKLRSYIKKNNLIKIHFNNDTTYPAYLRSKTSDIEVYYQVMYGRSYLIKTKTTPKVIIDCGANIGITTIFYKKQYPDCKIIAIEPEKGNYELLKKNTEKYKDIFCIKTAVNNKNTNFSIDTSNNDNWGFKIEETNQQLPDTLVTMTINDIIEKYQIDTIDILKIDIEGSEKELFQDNYEKWLPKVKYIMIELHDGFKEGCSNSLFKALINYKFRVKNNQYGTLIIEML